MLYNSKTRKKELFAPINDKHVTMYTCGPTVYSSAHIGNMRTMVMADLIKRTLIFFGLAVEHVINITDVGHLISESETDKIEQAARAEQKTAWDIAQHYTDEFMNDLHALNIIPATHFPRATQYIKEQIVLIQQLEENGHTYRTSDGIYFDTSTFANYGTLSGQQLDEKTEGARVEKNLEKKHASDFALWKFSPAHEKRHMEWDSPWGIGFPGWHIECSAMSTALLGQPIDIHTGAIDLLPVHHENETAQSEAASGNEFVRFWIHGEFVDVGNEKMAKSEGNFFTIADLIQRGYNPLAYRYLILNTHYRSKLNFSFEALEAAQRALYNIRDTVRDWNTPTKPDEITLQSFKQALADDINTPQALAITWECIKSNISSDIKAATILAMDDVYGLNLKQWIARPLFVPDHIIELARQRQRIREEKNFAESDRLRAEIEQAGFIVHDRPDGYTISEK